jgi:CRP-like cAMP-binding protein
MVGGYSSMNADLIHYLKQFDQLSNWDLELIGGSFQRKHFKTSDELSMAGQVATQLFFISEGILKITIPSQEERDMVYYFLENNQFMAFLYSLYGNIPATHGLMAACDCEVLCLTKKAFMYFLTRSHNLEPCLTASPICLWWR